METQLPALFINPENRSEENNYGKIPFSEVVVRRQPTTYWGRTWRFNDVLYASAVGIPHVLCLLYAPSTFTWDALGLASGLYVITSMIGINLSYHRNLSHRSFTLPKGLEYFFAYLGVLSGEGPPIEWVSNHRFHHKYTDKYEDPHSPTNGFLFSYVNWIFNHEYITQKCGERKNVEDLRQQWFYRFLQSTHIYHSVALGILLYKLGGLPYVVWGIGVRMVIGYQVIFLVNSVCHIWGHQAWNTGDYSKNNWLMGLLAFGEGWHNNHHAFEYSARIGLEWWQLDTTWLAIKILEYMGLAKDVKVPSYSAKQKMSFNNGEKTM